MFTSNFGTLKRLRAEYPDLEPVAISRGVPRWYRGRRELHLAPTRAMLNADLTHDEFERVFRAEILAQLDAQAMAVELGHNAVLLCWEQPGAKCHRRIVATWFETEAGLVVPEWGLGRLPSFAELPSSL